MSFFLFSLEFSENIWLNLFDKLLLLNDKDSSYEKDNILSLYLKKLGIPGTIVSSESLNPVLLQTPLLSILLSVLSLIIK